MTRPTLPSPATIGVVLATLLMGASVMGTPLYVASAASAAVTDQLAHACPSDTALSLYIPPGETPSEVMRLAESVAHVDPPIVTELTRVAIQSDSPVPKSISLVTRTGDLGQVHPALQPLGPDEVALSRTVLRQLGVRVGDRLPVETGDGGVVELAITQAFDDLPFRPEPPYWCGFSLYLRPNRQGDAGPPWGIVASSTHEQFGDLTDRGLEYRPTSATLTMPEARGMEDDFAAVQAAHAAAYGEDATATELPDALDRAAGLTTGVERSVEPTGLAGLVAALVTLVVAATFVAKEREQELRLVAIRGQSPWRTAIGLAPRLAAPVLVGAAAGAAVGVLGVRGLGPSPRLESETMVRAGLGLVLACVVALVLIVVRIAFIGDRTIDADSTARRRHAVPLELVAIPLAVISYRRLADGHALRMVGVHPQGGELLTQAFPLLGLVALAAGTYRPLRFVARRLRVAGRRLPRAVRLGFRRVVLDARAGALLVVVFALATGCFTTARVLAHTAERALSDKALNFVGADLAVEVYGPPPPIRPGIESTEVSRIAGHLDGTSVKILGVDRSTFAGVAGLRDGAASESLGALLARIAPTSSATLPAIVVGDASLDGTIRLVTTVGRPDIVVTAVGHTAFFPGSASGVMVVVDRTALQAQADFGRRELWFDDPPADVVEMMRADGARIGSVTRAANVFDSTNYRAQTWSYEPLAALGVLFVVIALGVQLLVINARAAVRQQADVVMRRSGFRTRDLWCAAVVEAGVPAILGTVAGMVGAWVVARISIEHLDTIPAAEPPPQLVLVPSTVLIPALATVAMIVVVTGIIVRSTRRADQMKAIRGFATAG
ncbi:MAG: FtsX-like permease family protein [Ilumatobacteraceae bacterium]